MTEVRTEQDFTLIPRSHKIDGFAELSSWKCSSPKLEQRPTKNAARSQKVEVEAGRPMQADFIDRSDTIVHRGPLPLDAVSRCGAYPVTYKTIQLGNPYAKSGWCKLIVIDVTIILAEVSFT